MWALIPDFGLGVNQDGTPEELVLGVSSSALNMRFRHGHAERFRGMASVYTAPPVTPYGVTHYTVGNTRFVVYPGLQKTYADDGTTQTEITNANNTGAIDNKWTGGVFNGVYVQNNGVDVPQYWAGNTANNLADLTGWPAGYKAGFLRSFKNYLVAGDITRGGVRERGTVIWSHVADPGTIPTSWDIADPTKDAGDWPLAETNGTLIDCLPMGDMNVIYKDDAIHYQQANQSVFKFTFGRLPGDTGLLASGCVAAFPGGHVYLTPGFDVLVHSGQGPQSILAGKMHAWLRNNINAAVATRSFLVNNSATSEVLICFPQDSAANCTMAIVWNWKDDKLGIRELPGVTAGSLGQVTLPQSSDTWGGDTETWGDDDTPWGYSDYSANSPRLIFARGSRLSMFDATSKDHGADFTSRIERKGLHFDSPSVVKLIRAVRPKFNAANGTVIKIQVGASMSPSATPTWQAPVDFTVGTDIEAHSFAAGRFLAIRMYSSSGNMWRLRSCELDIVAQGAY